MNARARLQVDTMDRDSMTTIVEFLDLEPITDPAVSTAVDQIIEEYLAAATAAGMHPGDARLFLLAEVVQQIQDERAYERVATARGVLPL